MVHFNRSTSTLYFRENYLRCERNIFRFASSSPEDYFKSPMTFLHIKNNAKANALTPAEYESVVKFLYTTMDGFREKNDGRETKAASVLGRLQKVMEEYMLKEAKNHINFTLVEEGKLVENVRYFEDDYRDFNLSQDFASSLREFVFDMKEVSSIEARGRYFIFLDDALLRVSLSSLFVQLPKSMIRTIGTLLPRDTVVTYIYSETPLKNGWNETNVINNIKKHLQKNYENHRLFMEWFVPFLETVSNSSRVISSANGFFPKWKIRDSREDTSFLRSRILNKETEYIRRLKKQISKPNLPWQILNTFPVRHLFFIEIP